MIKNTDPSKNMVRVPIEVMQLVIKEAIARDIEPSRLIALILENRYQGVNMPIAGVQIPDQITITPIDPVIKSEAKTDNEFKPERQVRKLIFED